MAEQFTICVGTVGAGVWFSPDGGDHWRRSKMALPFHAEPGEIQIRALALSPHDPHQVYAGSEAGLYRSVDNGASFELVPSPMDGMQIWSVAVHPHGPGRHLCRHQAARGVPHARRRQAMGAACDPDRREVPRRSAQGHQRRIRSARPAHDLDERRDRRRVPQPRRRRLLEPLPAARRQAAQPGHPWPGGAARPPGGDSRHHARRPVAQRRRRRELVAARLSALRRARHDLLLPRRGAEARQSRRHVRRPTAISSRASAARSSARPTAARPGRSARSRWSRTPRCTGSAVNPRIPTSWSPTACTATSMPAATAAPRGRSCGASSARFARSPGCRTETGKSWRRDERTEPSLRRDQRHPDALRRGRQGAAGHSVPRVSGILVFMAPSDSGARGSGFPRRRARPARLRPDRPPRGGRAHTASSIWPAISSGS